MEESSPRGYHSKEHTPIRTHALLREGARCDLVLGSGAVRCAPSRTAVRFQDPSFSARVKPTLERAYRQIAWYVSLVRVPRGKPARSVYAKISKIFSAHLRKRNLNKSDPRTPEIYMYGRNRSRSKSWDSVHPSNMIGVKAVGRRTRNRISTVCSTCYSKSRDINQPAGTTRSTRGEDRTAISIMDVFALEANFVAQRPDYPGVTPFFQAQYY